MLGACVALPALGWAMIARGMGAGAAMPVVTLAVLTAPLAVWLAALWAVRLRTGGGPPAAARLALALAVCAVWAALAPRLWELASYGGGAG